MELGVAQSFGEAVARGDFEAAHSLLTKEAQKQHPPAAMRRAVERMTAYVDHAPIVRVEAMDEHALEEWAAQQAGDVAWVYVALEGESFAEAVSVVLTETEGGVRIRELEWGRP